MPMENTYRCPHCGQENHAIKKIIYSSNWHYNQGLAKTKVRDLSGATVSLRQALKYNKRNTKARNLLGLVYYQMGEMVSALGEWVISVHFQPVKNPATGYIKIIQEDPAGLKAANKVIERYNQALEFINENNKDLAILELKKAVKLNPNYVRAYQLLGLLYMERKQYVSARKAFMKAIKIDRNNIDTLRYLKEVNQLHEKPEKTEEPVEGFRPIYDPNPIVIEQKSIRDYNEYNTSYISFINVLIGIIIGAAVIFLLIVPSITKSKAAQYNQAVVEYSAQISERNRDVTNLQKQVDELQAKVENYEGAAITNEDVTAATSYLLSAMKNYLQDSYKDAAYALAEINASALSDEQANIYALLRSQTKTYAMDEMYANGIDCYQNGDYTGAITSFHKVLNLDETYTKAVFYTARSYHQLGDTNNAAEFYKTIVDHYPESTLYEDSLAAYNDLMGIETPSDDNE